ncbi:MAG: cold shock domain-containing protein [Ectothiorhodospiraceae bacterium]|nr:cold shock domain-containing protein [Ectothiorhodospiraceae bacterium]
MQAIVKKWLKDKECGYLNNGAGPDILIRKVDLVRCQYLKVGVSVEFECHPVKGGLIAKKVTLVRDNKGGRGPNHNSKNSGGTKFIGVMT